MTDLLNQAFSAAAKLSAERQDSLAAWLLAELESDARWDEAFAASQDSLVSLAEEALNEHRAGRTETLDPDKL